MNQEESIRLIELYKSYTFLWDPKDKAYHNRAKRENTWQEMSIVLQQPASVLKAKIKTLMGSYRSERSRENKSRITGSGSEDVYESKWFAYKYFDFLRDKDNPNATLNSNRSEDSQLPITEDINDTPPVATSSTASQLHQQSVTTSTSQENTSYTSATKEGRKRKRVQDLDYSRMMYQAMEILQSSVTTSNDPHFTYALNLANELRKYNARTLSYVKKAIANILFEADVGRLPSYPTTSQKDDSSSSDISSLLGYDLERSLPDFVCESQNESNGDTLNSEEFIIKEEDKEELILDDESKLLLVEIKQENFDSNDTYNKNEDIAQISNKNKNISEQDDECQNNDVPKYNKKLYKCRICNKSFKFPLDLKKHQLIHSNKKTCTCKVCEKLLRHLRSHHLTHTGEKPYTCGVCNKSFER